MRRMLVVAGAALAVLGAGQIEASAGIAEGNTVFDHPIAPPSRIVYNQAPTGNVVPGLTPEDVSFTASADNRTVTIISRLAPIVPMRDCAMVTPFEAQCVAPPGTHPFWELDVNGGPVGDVLDVSGFHAGATWVEGGPGDDRLIGGGAQDFITGGLGRDVIACGGGSDFVTADVDDVIAADCENVTYA